MSSAFQFTCCESVGTPAGASACTCTAINVGSGVDHLVDGSSEPFEFRRTNDSGDVVIRVDPGDPNSNQVHHTVNLSTRVALTTIIAVPPKDALTPGDIRLFLKGIEMGTNMSVDNVTNDSFRLNSASSGSAANIGSGINIYDPGSSAPFDFHRVAVIDDGSDIHNENLAFWQDGDTAKWDLPNGHDQDSSTLSTNNVLVFLADYTFGDDAAGANVAGKDGEEWWVVWSLKYCGDPGQPLTDAVMRLQSHNGVGWTVEDTVHCRWTVGITPSSPVERSFLLKNTNWSGNSGLRLGIEVATNSLFVFNDFEHPSIHIERFKQVQE